MVKSEIQTRYNNWTPKPDFVAIIGDDEVKENVVTLKEMETGSQEKVDFVGAVSKIKSVINKLQ